MALLETADRPFSLFEGLGGEVMLLAAVLSDDAHFPGYQLPPQAALDRLLDGSTTGSLASGSVSSSTSS